MPKEPAGQVPTRQVIIALSFHDLDLVRTALLGEQARAQDQGLGPKAEEYRRLIASMDEQSQTGGVGF